MPPTEPEMAGRFAEAGIYDPAAPDASERLELLTHLAARGVTVAQMREADAAGQLVTAAADLMFFDVGTPLRPEEVARQCGVSVDRVVRARLATGLPVEAGAMLPNWASEDVAGFELGAALFGEAPVLAFSRVMGGSAGRVAEAAVTLFWTEVNGQLSASGAAPVEWAKANEEAASLVEVITKIMGHLLREHLELAIRRQRQAFTGAAGPEVAVAIGFVDLAGSTEWSEPLAVTAQAKALARFEEAAWDITNQQGGRIVKLIGDEAMFVTVDPAAACRIAIELCAAVEAEPSLPSARGAVGYGLVASRDGDYYGSLVNLVSRSVKAASEGRVVVTGEVRQRLEASGAPYRSAALEPERLRGIEQPVQLFAIEPIEGAPR